MAVDVTHSATFKLIISSALHNHDAHSSLVCAIVTKRAIQYSNGHSVGDYIGPPCELPKMKIICNFILHWIHWHHITAEFNKFANTLIHISYTSSVMSSASKQARMQVLYRLPFLRPHILGALCCFLKIPERTEEDADFEPAGN